MSCLGWNCRGLGNSCTVRNLSYLIKDHNPKFIFLIETISFANKIEELRVRFSYEQCFSVDRMGRSGGLVVMFKSRVNCQIASYSQNHIDVVFLENNIEFWRLSCLYGYPKRGRRRNP